MYVLQAIQDSTTIDSILAAQSISSQELFYYTEVCIIAAVLIFQICYSIYVYANIKILKQIFSNPLKIENEEIANENYQDFHANEEEEHKRVTILQTAGKNKIILRIKDTLNSYLLNNYGAAVNFSIIKDIIDREVEVKDEEISQSIPTPLYLGLAATMIGIIFGLFAMPGLNSGLSSGANAAIDVNFSISPLITGIKVAMAASLIGLLCTTILSSFLYKGARKKVIKEKNDQLSYLQANLLPELVRAEDTGVSGLKASLDRFAREATTITDHVNIAVNQTGQNLQLQQEVISKIEKLNMTKVSKINLELFDQLGNNMDAFNQFSKYLNQMEQIADNLNNFSSRTEDIDTVISQIDSTLEESRQLTKFLSGHFEKMEASGNSAREAVDLMDAHFREAIEKLREEIDKRINHLNKDANNHEIYLKGIYEDIGKKLSKLTEQHLDAFRASYTNAVPDFKQLENLELLKSIKNQYSEDLIELRNDSDKNTEKIVLSIDRLNQSLANLKNTNNFRNRGLPRESTNNHKKKKEKPKRVIFLITDMVKGLFSK